MAESVSVDFRPVLRALEVVNTNIGTVSQNVEVLGTQIDTVAREQSNTKDTLERLYAEFTEYVERDVWANAVSTARQELTLIRQEVETRFGHYDEVRRHTTGVLQAVDASLVRQGTIRTAAEELTLSCPRYWLAPGLVALAAWIANDRALAEKGMAEAIRRDDSKVSLFFALVSRRAGRMQACVQWLVRYFQIQSPLAMDREVVVMLDGLANGVFGGAGLVACSKVIDEWMIDLQRQAGFEDEQRARWAKALDVMTPTIATNEYSSLRKYSATWPDLEVSLAASRRHRVVKSFFERLFTGEIVVDPTIENAVDNLLDSLVSNFDDEELPLRRKARQNEIVIEVDSLPGRPSMKRAEADRRFVAEREALKEQSSFAAVLTNSAMFADRYGATLATQRYAVSRSRAWIVAGFNDLTARDRSRIPAAAEVTCGSWKGVSEDGSDEPALVADLQQHYAQRAEQAIAAISLSKQTLVIAVIGALFGLLMINANTWFGLLILLAVGAYSFFQYQGLDKARQHVRVELEKERDQAARMLKATLAELVDYRREVAAEDSHARGVVELLESLSSPQFVLNRPGQSRAVQN